MTLPVNATPVYMLTIPSTNKQLKYRPFLVKEEKALLIAYQSEDELIMVETIKKIIKDCALSEIDVDCLATFDIEYIFAQLRSKSIGEFVELLFGCSCTTPITQIKLNFDISKLQVEFNAEHSNNIILFEDVGIKLKYPTLDIIKRIKDVGENDADQMFAIIIECVECIYNDDEIFMAKDQPFDDLKTFIDNLTTTQFKKIQTFFETMPRIRQIVEYDCPACNTHHTQTLEGLNNFF